MARRIDPGEIATIGGGRDITRGYVDAMPYLPTTDDVFRQAGGWRGWKELARDDQLAATFAQRRLAVVSRPTEVEPGGDRRIDRRAADLVRATLDRIGWDRVTDQMLWARLFGFAVAEIIWGVEDGELGILAIKVRDAERFAFGVDGAPLLRTTARPAGEPLPDRKFWVVSVGAPHHDEPYGRGLAHALYWPIWFKRQGARFWAIYLEKFGAPTAVGTFPAGTDGAERARLLEAVGAIHTDSGLVIPEGMSISLIEASRAGQAGYEAWLAYWDRAIAKIVLGQTMTTEDGSSLSQALVHQEVRQEIVRADADLVCETANATWVRWLVDLILPGAAPPRIWRDMSDQEDLETRSRRDATLASLGWRLTPEAVQRVYGDDYAPARPELAATPGGSAVRAAAERARPAAPADQIADRLETEAGPGIHSWIDQIRAMVEAAGSLGELRQIIREAFDALPTAAVESVLAQAMIVAEAAGRADILEAADD